MNPHIIPRLLIAGLAIFHAGLSLTAQSASDEKIIIYTNIPKGDSINLYTMPVDIDSDDIWVDLNDDGLMQEKESVFFNYASIKYEVNNPKITIHGRVFQFGCSKNKIEAMDLSGASSLVTLYCNSNDLSTIDLTANKNLLRAHLFDNKLKAIDLNENKELIELRIQKNQLKALDLSSNTKMAHVHCYENMIAGKAMQKLVKSLPIRPKEEEADIYIVNTTATLPDGNIALVADVSEAKQKHWTVFDQNSVAFPKEYPGATPTETKICVKLETNKAVGSKIRIAMNAKKELQNTIWIDLNEDGVKQPAETVTTFGANHIVEYPVSSKKITIYGAITYLNCSDNELSNLDVMQNAYIDTLICNKNKLIDLSLGKSRELKYLDCSTNDLGSLLVQGSPKLRMLYCYDNQISDNSATSLINSLAYPTDSSDGIMVFVDTKKNPEDRNRCNKGDVQSAANKGWKVMDAHGDASHPIDYAGYGVGVEKIDRENGISVRQQGEQIAIVLPLHLAGLDISVFDATGQIFARRSGVGETICLSLPGLSAGTIIYVRAGNAVVSIMIR